MSFFSNFCVTESKKTDAYYASIRNSNMDEGKANVDELTAEITQLKTENTQLQQDKEVLQSNYNALLQKNNENEILITGYKQQIDILNQQKNAMTIHVTSGTDEEKMLMTSKNAVTLQHHETVCDDQRLIEFQMKLLGNHAKDNPQALQNTIEKAYSIDKDGTADGVHGFDTDGTGSGGVSDSDAHTHTDSDSSNMSDEELERIQNEKRKVLRKSKSKSMTKEEIDTFDPTFDGAPPSQTKRVLKKRKSNLIRDRSIASWEVDEIEQQKDEMVKHLTSLIGSSNSNIRSPMSMDNV